MQRLLRETRKRKRRKSAAADSLGTNPKVTSLSEDSHPRESAAGSTLIVGVSQLGPLGKMFSSGLYFSSLLRSLPRGSGKPSPGKLKSPVYAMSFLFEIPGSSCPFPGSGTGADCPVAPAVNDPRLRISTRMSPLNWVDRLLKYSLVWPNFGTIAVTGIRKGIRAQALENRGAR